MNEDTVTISATRLRVGVLLILLWWLPFWMFAPAIADAFGFNSNNARLVIMVIQTIIGIIGMWIVGKQIATIMKQTSFKQMLPKIWHILRTGKIDTV